MYASCGALQGHRHEHVMQCLASGLQGLLHTSHLPCLIQGYKQVCGFADVWGDGIIPLESAHLDGAQGELFQAEIRIWSSLYSG